jgi:hypothetical protein
MNIGLVVNNLGNSEQSYEVIQLANKISETSNSLVPSIFFQNIMPNILEPTCLCMNITGISNFKGKIVAFGLDSASVVVNNNTNTENWLVLWDIPWLYSIINYPVCIEILKKFKIIVRSQSHKNIVENYTGRTDIQMVEDMNELIKCLT